MDLSPPPLPSVRFTALLDVTVAWYRARQPQASSTLPEPPDADALWAKWTAFVEGLSTTTTDEAERNRLAIAFGQAFGPVSPGTTFPTRAMDALRDEVGGPSMVERLQVALIDLGCWPSLPPAGQRPAHLSGFGEYARELTRATHGGHARVLRRLLDWDGSGALSQGLLSISGSGLVLPPLFLASQMTGWAWTVRNASLPCLEAWLAAGADPNTRDAAGRPVLAYVHQASHLEALLAAGADPLAADLPMAQRRANLWALWQSWQNPLFWHQRTPASEDWGAGVAYLRTSLERWPAADLREATADLRANAYAMAFGDLHDDPGTRALQALAKDLGRGPVFTEGDEVEILGHRWSFAGAAARSRLLGADVGRAQPALPPPPEGQAVTGVRERVVATLADLPRQASAAREQLAAHAPRDVAAALCLCMESLSVEGRSWPTSRLAQRLGVALKALVVLDPDWPATVAPVLDAWVQTVRGTWAQRVAPRTTTAEEVESVVGWLVSHGPSFPPAQEARWLVHGLAVRDAFGGLSRPAARERLVALLREGELADLAACDPLTRRVFEELQAMDPEMKALVTALSASRRLEREWAPAPTPSARPRM